MRWRLRARACGGDARAACAWRVRLGGGGGRLSAAWWQAGFSSLVAGFFFVLLPPSSDPLHECGPEASDPLDVRGDSEVSPSMFVGGTEVASSMFAGGTEVAPNYPRAPCSSSCSSIHRGKTRMPKMTGEAGAASTVCCALGKGRATQRLPPPKGCSCGRSCRARRHMQLIGSTCKQTQC